MLQVAERTTSASACNACSRQIPEEVGTRALSFCSHMRGCSAKIFGAPVLKRQIPWGPSVGHRLGRQPVAYLGNGAAVLKPYNTRDCRQIYRAAVNLAQIPSPALGMESVTRRQTGFLQSTAVDIHNCASLPALRLFEPAAPTITSAPAV